MMTFSNFLKDPELIGVMEKLHYDASFSTRCFSASAASRTLCYVPHNFSRPFAQLLFCQKHLASSSKRIYRQWVSDGENIPLDDLITLAIKLIRNGIMGVVNQQKTSGNALS
jgi:hypothetical protein